MKPYHSDITELGEPDAHVMMRHARMVVGLALLIAVIGSATLFFFALPIAYVSLLPLPVLVTAFALVCFLERQSRAKTIRIIGNRSISLEETAMSVQYRGIYIALGLTLLFALASFIVATTMVDEWSMVAITATVLFLLSALFMLPFIPLMIEDSARDETDKLDRESAIREEIDRQPMSRIYAVRLPQSLD